MAKVYKEFIVSIAESNHVESGKHFKKLMAERVLDKLEELRLEAAQTIGLEEGFELTEEDIASIEEDAELMEGDTPELQRKRADALKRGDAKAYGDNLPGEKAKEKARTQMALRVAARSRKK